MSLAYKGLDRVKHMYNDAASKLRSYLSNELDLDTESEFFTPIFDINDEITNYCSDLDSDSDDNINSDVNVELNY